MLLNKLRTKRNEVPPFVLELRELEYLTVLLEVYLLLDLVVVLEVCHQLISALLELILLDEVS